MKDNQKRTDKIFSNKAVVGKPYLDIDRVINEEIPASSNQKRKDL